MESFFHTLKTALVKTAVGLANHTLRSTSSIKFSRNYSQGYLFKTITSTAQTNTAPLLVGSLFLQ